MKNLDKALRWLARSKSNLAYAKLDESSPEILYEDRCFNAQQSVEKALKALCIAHGLIFSRTHNISYLVETLNNGGVDVPEFVQMSQILTTYAVETRYPDDHSPVDRQEYDVAVEIAESVVDWVGNEIVTE